MMKFYGDDTERDHSKAAVQAEVLSISRSQGGTEHVLASGAKGNSDPIDVEQSERVNSDPQGHTYYDYPRRDRDNHNIPDSDVY